MKRAFVRDAFGKSKHGGRERLRWICLMVCFVIEHRAAACEESELIRSDSSHRTNSSADSDPTLLLLFGVFNSQDVAQLTPQIKFFKCDIFFMWPYLTPEGRQVK